MKDYFGVKLKVGTKVVYICPGYREYRTALVKRFTAQFVILETEDGTEFKQKPKQLITIIAYETLDMLTDLT